MCRKRKIYFYDIGVRNAIINNLNPIYLRNDIGALFENLFIAEKVKSINFVGKLKHFYFLRSYSNQEVDLIEQDGRQFVAWEIKWRKKRKYLPSVLKKVISNYTWKVVNKDNILQFV